MRLSIDNHFGIHDDALKLRSRRMELMASNLANADTPGYKARDIDFRAALNEAQASQGVNLRTTHALHIQLAEGVLGTEVKYRVPTQPSLDGNTVDPQLENAAFAENAARYEATMSFLNSKINGLRSVLRGE